MKLGAVDASGRRSPEPTGQQTEIKCDSVIIAIGRGPNSFLQIKSGLKMGQKSAILIDDKYRTSIPGVFAAGDVVTGETLVGKAMAKGREAAQRIHEYLMNAEDRHVSLYDRYYVNKKSRESYADMRSGIEETLPPE